MKTYSRLLICFLTFNFSMMHNLSGQGSQQPVSKSTTDAPYGYYEYIPEGYDSGSNFPIVIFLHGLGEIGNGNEDLYKIKLHGPHKRVEQGKTFPAIILSPQSDDWWNIARIDEFVEWAFTHYKADKERLYVTGLSMGGGGAWLYARDYPDKLAAIVPICGAATATQTEKLVSIPTWTFHNDGDPVVNVQLTYDWINGIKAAGGMPKMTIYHSTSHDAWTPTYNNEEMWNWLFARQRSEPWPVILNAEDMDNYTVIYPNPIKDEITIQCKDLGAGEVMLTDMNGKMIQQWSAYQYNDDRLKLTLETKLSTGIYLLHLKTQSRSLIVKVKSE